MDEALFRFYKARIHDVSSIHDLNRFVKEQGVSDSLFATGKRPDRRPRTHTRRRRFSGVDPTRRTCRSLRYAYAPGEEHDGITLQVPVTLMQHLSPGLLDWAIPGWREEQIRTLLRALPKSLARPAHAARTQSRRNRRRIKSMVGRGSRRASLGTKISATASPHQESSIVNRSPLQPAPAEIQNCCHSPIMARRCSPGFPQTAC